MLHQNGAIPERAGLSSVRKDVVVFEVDFEEVLTAKAQGAAMLVTTSGFSWEHGIAEETFRMANRW